MRRKTPWEGTTADARGAGLRRAAAVKDFETDILCNPWTFGKGDQHVPNDADRTIVPQDGEWVEKEKCFDIAALPNNPLEELRALNAEQ